MKNQEPESAYQNLIFNNRLSVEYERLQEYQGSQGGASYLTPSKDVPDGSVGHQLTRLPSRSVYENARKELDKDKRTGWFGESTEEMVQCHLMKNWRLNGDFVVWLHKDMKLKKKSLALSVISGRTINHFQIRGVAFGQTYKFYIVKQHYQAGSIRELLDYYHQNSLPLMDSEVKLTTPLGK